jgi:2-isopropylmalate synthase/UPF0716 protein FxsA
MGYFLLYLFIEVMVSSSIASSLGGLTTFFEIITSALIGIFILQNFKFSLLDSINQARRGEITQEEFVKTNVGRAIGAVLLIVPGFFTDIVGLVLQFGFLTMIFSKIFSFKKANTQTEFKSGINNQYYNKGEDDEIIDVEIIDSSSTIR